MLDQEINSQQGKSLEIEQIDSILTMILELELLRPVQERLNQEEIIAMSATIFKKSYARDKFEMIVEQVQRMENSSDLLEIIQNSMESHLPISRSAQEPSELKIVQERYEDVMELGLYSRICAKMQGGSKAGISCGTSGDKMNEILRE